MLSIPPLFFSERLSLCPPSLQWSVRCPVGVGKSRFSIVVLEVSYVFLESSSEGSTCLAHVRHLTVAVGQLVYATFSVFALGIEFLFEVFSDRKRSDKHKTHKYSVGRTYSC